MIPKVVLYLGLAGALYTFAHASRYSGTHSRSNREDRLAHFRSGSVPSAGSPIRLAEEKQNSSAESHIASLRRAVASTYEKAPEDEPEQSIHEARGPPVIIREFRNLFGEGNHHHDEEKVEHCFGLSRPMCALVLGTASGISLPIGSTMGIVFPVKDEVVAVLLAIGGGSLLFAVTVELYGHALHELKRGRLAFWSEMFVIMVGAVSGSWFYTACNEWLEQKIKEEAQNVDIAAADEIAANALTSTMFVGRMVEERSPIVLNEEGSVDYSAVRKLKLKTKAKRLWMKLRIIFRFGKWVRLRLHQQMTNRNRVMLSFATQEDTLPELLRKASSRLPEQLTEEERAEIAHAKAVAMSLFLGLFIDGVPECMLMGFLAAEERLSMVLVISLIVANFPEAFSSASLLKTAKAPAWAIISLWTGLMLMVGVFCGLTCYLLLAAFPDYGPGGKLPLHILIFSSFVEGLAGGAMITLIAAVILPEAMEKATTDGPICFRSGFCCAIGFLLSVLLKVIFDETH